MIGVLSDVQRRALARHVEGKVVHDFGAGDLSLSLELLKLGAREVFAIDKAPRPRLPTWPEKLHYEQAYFHELGLPEFVHPRFGFAALDTVLLSWPINHVCGLLPLLLPAKTILYLGKNTDGTACGSPEVFEEMVRRRLLDYVPDRKNCLVVTGERLNEPRQPTPEEYAGLTASESYFTYEESERLPKVEVLVREKAPRGRLQRTPRHG